MRTLGWEVEMPKGSIQAPEGQGSDGGVEDGYRELG